MNLASDPVSDLIPKIAIPAGVGMLFGTLLNVVDTLYAGILSATALAAMSLAGPVFFLVLTLGIGVGQATNALVGNRLGAEDEAGARRLAVQTMSFAIIMSLVLSLIAFILAPRLFAWMGGEPPYLSFAIAYMRVVLLGSVFFSLSLVVNAVLNTRGNTRSYRNAQIVAFFVNIVLDPLLMFDFGLGLGVVGVAVATVLVQAGVLVYLLSIALKLDFLQKLQAAEFIPRWRSFVEIASQSVPTSVSMALVAAGSIIIVSYVTRFGEPALAAYAIALRLEQVILLPVIGINIAALSLTGVNLGARNYHRLQEIYRLSLFYALAMMVLGGFLVFVLGGFIMQVFSDSAEVRYIGTVYLKFEAFILPAYAAIFLSAAVLQGLKRPNVSLFFNLFRQVIGQLLLMWLIVVVMQSDITGIWWSVLLINWLVALIMFGLVRVLLVNIEQNGPTNKFLYT